MEPALSVSGGGGRREEEWVCLVGVQAMHQEVGPHVA